MSAMGINPVDLPVNPAYHHITWYKRLRINIIRAYCCKIITLITFNSRKPPDRSNRTLASFSHNFNIRAVVVEIFGYTAILLPQELFSSNYNLVSKTSPRRQ